MPIKTKDLQYYFAWAPDCEPDPAFREYWNVDNLKVDNDYWYLDKNDWVREYFKGLRDAKEIMAAPWGTRLLTCDELFLRYPRLRTPFAVMEWDDIGMTILWKDDSIGAIQAALDNETPFKWGEIDVAPSGRLSKYEDAFLFGRHLWILTKEEKFAGADELRLLFLEALDKERTKFERLKRKFSGGAGARIVDRRESIGEEVRIFVWRRDEGRCVKCGKQERLEFDHIIPVSKGGSSTERNIQLLCESCNRKKSDAI
jgi:hypothetical protein